MSSPVNSTLHNWRIREPGAPSRRDGATIMHALLNDLRLRDRRNVLKDLLEHAVPTTLQDVVIISGATNPQCEFSRSKTTARGWYDRNLMYRDR
jgi:hypothetical protein